ncbi:insoluble domain protein [Rhodococcus sp. NPDC019627]|uniref:insoluble domain protein n=1 Tax=unclassified Rhodococcus (in: high G+C Gram-positive bacteria) TaxID=192944 RepID=UPI0033E751AD
MNHNEIGGQHRLQKQKAAQRVALLGAVTVVIGLATNGMASAAPDQPGITTPEAPAEQAGITSTPSTPAESAPAEVIEPAQPDPVYWGPAPAEPIVYQAIPNFDYESNQYIEPEGGYADVAPVQFQDLHLPQWVEPTQPFIAPRDTLRLGELHLKQPNWVSDVDKDRTNNTVANVESATTTFWRSLGVETSRAERISAAQIGAGAVGAVTVGTAAAVVAGTACGLAAGTAAGIVGMSAGMVFLPGIGWAPVGVLATAAGAAAGVAACAPPAFVVGAGLGGLGAAAAVTPFAAADKGEPREVEIADVDQPAITEQTEQVLEQWAADPIGTQVVSAVQDTVEAAPVIDQQVRDFAAAQPGGKQALEQVDTALTTFFGDSTPGLASQLISDAIGAGIPAPVSA